ncbi:MAG: PKD domain-containing protein [Bacteroidales bacterium]|jgi:PKD repeat protein|nr:PKD domain-containing protein [Bacteroidales bacterium]
MKKIFFLSLFVIFCFTTNYVRSQQTYGGLPVSFEKTILSTNIDKIVLEQPNMDLIMQEDVENERLGKMKMVGRVIPKTLTMQNSGTYDLLPDGTVVWRLAITVPNAMSLTMLYSHFYLPEGSKLFLYNENKKQIFGALDHRSNPRKSLNTSTMMIQGETTYLEFFAPQEIANQAIIDIEGVIYNYRDVQMFIGRYGDDAKLGGFGSSYSCEVNINCPEGDSWQTQKKGVCVIYTGTGGLCSADLINNTSNDGTPYILTADHCGGNSPEATFHTWQFYFHYESPTCANPGVDPVPVTPITQGATFRARGPNSSTGSDFLLLELDGATESELATMGCYYNGWDRTGLVATSGVAIHHPSCDIMKISKFETALTSVSFTGFPNSGWDVNWSLTPNGGGMTEGGSSGSSLFDCSNKLIIGTLSGGPYIDCSETPGHDIYGKFSAHWTTNGTTPDRQLAPWLDAANTGAMTCQGRIPSGANTTITSCDGSTPPSGSLTAMFTYNPNPATIIEGQCINFIDASLGGPTLWNWNFPGAQTSSSTLQNPNNICYLIPGVYDVMLTVNNGVSAPSTYVCSGCVIVEVDPNAPIINFSANHLVVPIGGVVNFTNLSTNGPFESWAWTFENGTPSTSALQTPPPITYTTPGCYYVELRGQQAVTHTQRMKKNEAYICVVNPPTTAPTANFVANHTFIAPGSSVNFIDLSTGTPFTWAWEFTGAASGQTTSTAQHPQGIVYPNAGCFKVKLTVSNSVGSDFLVKEQYICVGTTDPCTLPPVADFRTEPRIIPYNTSIFFENTATGGNPTYSEWHFYGGTPDFVVESSPSTPILYSTPGIYKVSLTTSNNCGSTSITKDKYIYVFSGSVGAYCDTISSRLSGEQYNPLTNPHPGNQNRPQYGYIIGHSSDNYRYFANYFDVWTFNKIESIIIPLHQVNQTTFNGNAYVNFCIWAPDGDKPSAEPLASKKVFFRDLFSGQNNIIQFDTPISIDGPFYAGFKINYVDVNPSDNISDDLLAAYLINRGSSPLNNKLFFKKNDASAWETTNELFGYSAAMMIKTGSCLVELEDINIGDNVKIFPNPTNSQITIQLGEENLHDIYIQLMDITGKLQTSKLNNSGNSEYNMDLSNLPSGVYMLNIKTDKFSVNKKIILTK